MARVLRTNNSSPIIPARTFYKPPLSAHLKFVKRHSLDPELASHTSEMLQYFRGRDYGDRSTIPQLQRRFRI
jgi:hypothetical protein